MQTIIKNVLSAFLSDSIYIAVELQLTEIKTFHFMYITYRLYHTHYYTKSKYITSTVHDILRPGKFA